MAVAKGHSDYIIKHDRKPRCCFANLIGIDSPGLTSRSCHRKICEKNDRRDPGINFRTCFNALFGTSSHGCNERSTGFAAASFFIILIESHDQVNLANRYAEPCRYGMWFEPAGGKHHDSICLVRFVFGFFIFIPSPWFSCVKP